MPPDPCVPSLPAAESPAGPAQPAPSAGERRARPDRPGGVGGRPSTMTRPVFDPGIGKEDRALLEAAPELLVAAHRPAPCRPRRGRAARAGRALWVPMIAFFYGVLPGGWIRLCFLVLDEEEDELVDAVFRWGGRAVAAMLITPVFQTALILLGLGEAAVALAAASFACWVAIALRHLREPDASRAARTYHGRYLLPGDFDRVASRLLLRAQRACDAVLGSAAHRDGLLDGTRNSVLLSREEWEIASTLAEHTRLRREEAARRPERVTPRLRALLEPRRQALAASVGSVIARVEALETYARRARELDDAYAEWQAVHDLPERDERYLSLLAGTVRHDLARAEIDRLSGSAGHAGAALKASAYYGLTKDDEK
jgi:hypothetical protein